jgi:hypothetical protein
MNDPLARVSPSRGGDYACNVRDLFSPSVRGRAAEGGRGSLTHHLEFDAWLNRIKNPLPTADAVGYTLTALPIATVRSNAAPKSNPNTCISR